jgi:hypothetical protein
MERHFSILGALFIACGLLGLGIAAIVFLGLAGAGALSGEAEAMAILGGIGTVVGGFLAVISLPQIITGVGLIQRKSWSRIMTMILGALSLLNIPIGTAIGIYALWAMTRPETPALLNR